MNQVIELFNSYLFDFADVNFNVVVDGGILFVHSVPFLFDFKNFVFDDCAIGCCNLCHVAHFLAHKSLSEG